MRSFLAFLTFSYSAIWLFSFLRTKNLRIFLRISIFVLSILLFLSLASSEEKVQYLKKVGEIKEGFSSERENFFIKITGLCCDDEGNLYVADSGWNKIFKFDPNGKFIMSFGREGQGPGEFLAHPKRAYLKISFGNDGKLYVNDHGNERLSIFSKEGKFIKSFKLPPYTYDAPVVNSKGDIYLLSKSGIKVIDCYDSNFKYKTSLLDIEEHLQFPFGKPSFPLWVLRKPGEDEIMKVLTEDDFLIVVSNYSFNAFVFNPRHTLAKVFNVLPQEWKKEYKMLIKMEKEREKKLKKEFPSVVRTWVYPFYNLFITPDKAIGLSSIKADGEKVIYKYDLRGKLLGKIICEKSISFLVETSIAVKKSRYFFYERGKEEYEQIGIYELVNKY